MGKKKLNSPILFEICYYFNKMYLQHRKLPKIYRKSLLYKSGVEYADFGLNHVEGCAHGCTYPCYAMMLKKRTGQIKTYDEWCSPKIVENALELLEKEIPKYKNAIKSVYLCFSSDPFMYKVKEVNNLSLKIIERLNKDKIKVFTITKGLCPSNLGDVEKYRNLNEYGITLVSLSEDFRKKYEPFTAPIIERIKSLKSLHDKGLKTWVSMEPYPTPNIFRQNLFEILKEISFVDKIVFGRWNYNSLTSDFGNYRSFYNFTSEVVIKYCKQNRIECHIKDGTISSAKTVRKVFDSQKIKDKKYDESYTEPFFAFG